MCIRDRVLTIFFSPSLIFASSCSQFVGLLSCAEPFPEALDRSINYRCYIQVSSPCIFIIYFLVTFLSLITKILDLCGLTSFSFCLLFHSGLLAPIVSGHMLLLLLWCWYPQILCMTGIGFITMFFKPMFAALMMRFMPMINRMPEMVHPVTTRTSFSNLCHYYVVYCPVFNLKWVPAKLFLNKFYEMIVIQCFRHDYSM